MSGVLILVIAFLVLIMAIGMKIVAKTCDSPEIFKLLVYGFLIVYVLAALAISWLNPQLNKAQISSFSRTLNTSPTTRVPVDNLPQPPQDKTIME